MISAEDREILRQMGVQVAQLAARAIEQEKRVAWYQHNALEPTRPLVFCDPENGWNEIIMPDQLKCKGKLATESFDEERIRAELREQLRLTRDCRVEVIMKDNHTIRNDPSRVIRWVQIAREEAAAL